MAQVTPSQLEAVLKRNFSNLYMIYGEEPLQRQESADFIREQARSNGFTERSVYVATGADFDWSQVAGAASALSLFAARQIIEVRIPSGKPGREGGQVLQQLAQQMAQAQDILLLLVLEDRLDRTAKNTAWFKALDQSGVCIPCNPVERSALQQWLVRRLAQAGLRVDASDDGKQCLAFLADHTEGNLLAAHQEIEKLALLSPAAEQPHILTFEQVQKSVMDVARYDLFQLTQIILSGDIVRALRVFDGLVAEGYPVVRIHWVLADEIATLWRVRRAMDQRHPLPMALKESRVWGPREKLYERVLPKLDIAVCNQLLQQVQVCDGIVKGLKMTGWPMDPVQSLRSLVLKMITAVASPKRKAIYH